MDTPSPDNEQRRYPRVAVNITIAYQINRPAYVRILIGDNEEEALALNISEGGVAFLTTFNIAVSTHISMEFKLYEMDKKSKFVFYRSIKAQGVVEHSAPAENGQYRTGVSFNKIEAEDRSEIARFVGMGISPQKP